MEARRANETGRIDPKKPYFSRVQQSKYSLEVPVELFIRQSQRRSFRKLSFGVLREWSQREDAPWGILAHPQDRRESRRGIFRNLGVFIPRLVVTATNARLGFE